MYTVTNYDGTLIASVKEYKTQRNAWARVLKLAELNSFKNFEFIDYVKDDGQKARYKVRDGKPVRIR